jgi:hypothetical protein
MTVKRITISAAVLSAALIAGCSTPSAVTVRVAATATVTKFAAVTKSATAKAATTVHATVNTPTTVAQPYTTSCTLVPSNSSWGPSWAGTEMPQLTVTNSSNSTVTVVYLDMNYTNSSGVIIGSDGSTPWVPDVSDIPPGATAVLSPTMAGFTPPLRVLRVALSIRREAKLEVKGNMHYRGKGKHMSIVGIP